MVMPSAGVRPMGTSQKTRLVPTPLPSGDGQSTSAGATFFAGGGAGLRVVGTGLRAGMGRREARHQQQEYEETSAHRTQYTSGASSTRREHRG